MLLLDTALPSGTPPWIAAIVAVGLALINTVGLVLVARAQRAGAKDGDLAKRVETLEANEPADLAEARAAAEGALAEAKTATESAERVAGDLKRHVEDEQRRRDTAREIGRERDQEIAKKLDALKEKVNEQGTGIKVLEAKLETGGGSRRGR